MKTPTWAYIIGILMLLIGGCGAVKDMQSINTQTILDMQKTMLEDMSGNIKSINKDSVANNTNDTITSTKSNTEQVEIINNMSKTMEKMLYMSDYTKKWRVRFGYVGLVLSVIYILAGIFLIIRKSFSMKLTYTALGLYILFGIIQILVFSRDETKGFMAMTSLYSYMFSIIFDVVILIAILGADKTAYKIENIKKIT